jgi:hypothetical protein
VGSIYMNSDDKAKVAAPTEAEDEGSKMVCIYNISGTPYAFLSA